MSTTTTPDTVIKPLAVVTGASSGIGFELAKQFATNGFDVLLTAEDAAIHRAARDIAALGASAQAEQVDLADPGGVAKLHGVIRAGGRAVSAAALNAGIGVGGRFDQTDLDADLRLIALNVTSTVHLAKLLVRDMVARGEGRLLFTASIAATMPGPYYATYAASKAFVHSFAEALHTELEDTGVSVTSLMPGPTDTEFFDRADMGDTRAAASKKDDPADVAKDGFEALMAGKDRVVGGSPANVVQTVAAKILPDSVKAAGHGLLTKPGSGD